MRAVAISAFGAPPTVIDRPEPEPQAGEVVVEVEWSSINGFDLRMAAGDLRGLFSSEPPIVLGRDLAGRVSAVGAGVSSLAVGDEVFGAVTAGTLRGGAFAERVPVPVTNLARRPDGLDARGAAALPVAGVAAQRAVDQLDLRPGETVLVTGATGGVGAFALQLAARCGATVIATATPDRAGFVRHLGAAEVVDRDANLVAAVRTVAAGGVDAAVLAAGSLGPVLDAVRPDGRVASVVGLGDGVPEDRAVVASSVRTVLSPEALGALGDLVVEGSLVVPIAATYGLDEVARAFQDFRGPKVGKLAVRVR